MWRRVSDVQELNVAPPSPIVTFNSRRPIKKLSFSKNSQNFSHSFMAFIFSRRSENTNPRLPPSSNEARLLLLGNSVSQWKCGNAELPPDWLLAGKIRGSGASVLRHVSLASLIANKRQGQEPRTGSAAPREERLRWIRAGDRSSSTEPREERFSQQAFNCRLNSVFPLQNAAGTDECLYLYDVFAGSES